jgi:uncharacterized repeat protein (TIGR01451 family)
MNRQLRITLIKERLRLMLSLRRWRRSLSLLPIMGLIALFLMPLSALAATIQGIAFTDWNQNGVHDPWEPILAKQYVTLNGPSGNYGAYTDANGRYSFTSLTGGSYTLSCNDPLYTGWTQTTPEKTEVGMIWYPGYTVTLSNQNRTVDFGFVDPFPPPNTPPKINITQTEYTVEAGVTGNFVGNFTDPDSGDTHVFLWDFGGGETANTKEVKRTFNTIGVQTIKYTVTDSRGDSASINFKVTVKNKLPKVTVNASVGSIRIGNAITFQGKIEDTAGETHTLLWDFGDGKTASSLNTTHIYTAAGTYSAKLTATDNHGGVGTAQVAVTITNDKPKVNIGGNRNIRINQGVSFSAQVIDPDFGTKPTYVWDLGDGNTVNNTTRINNHNYTKAGTYKVKLTVTDSWGAVGFHEATVTVINDPPKVNIGGNRNIRITQGVSFSAQVTDPDLGTKPTYVWDLGDGNTVNNTTRINNHNYTKAGTYKVKLTVTDSWGAVGFHEATVTVINDPPKVNAGDDVTIRVGDTVNFNGQVTDPDLGNSPTYKWTFEDGGTANTLNATHTFSKKGTFKAILTATDSYGATGSDELIVNVKGAVPVVKINGDSLIAVNLAELVNLSGSFTDADGGTHNFVWKFGEGNTKVGAASIGQTLTTSHRFKRPSPESGFVAILEITDNEGNKGTAQVTIHVRSMNTDPCITSVPTLRSKRMGAWQTASTWDENRAPNARDWVLVNHQVVLVDYPNTSINEGKVGVQGLCIEKNGILKGFPSRHGLPTPWMEISAGIIHNKGKIEAEMGLNGSGPYNDRNQYNHATEGGSINITKVGKFINDGKVLAGRGGDDLIYKYFQNQWGTHSRRRGLSVNAKSGAGGQIKADPYTFTNRGSILAGHGGFASVNSRSNPPWGQWWYSNRSLYKIQFSNAHGGHGGLINFRATNVRNASDSINTGQFIAGDGGDAVFFTKFSGHGSSHAGRGGTVRVDVSKQFGLMRVGKGGRWSRWEPIFLQASKTTRIEGGEEVVIFAGDNANMDLRELVEGAITAEKTITIAVGEGGTVDLTGVSGEVFKAAEKVEIFADKLVLDEGVSLETLTNAPNVETGPSKIIYEVSLFSKNYIVGQPNETIPVTVEVINGSPADDTYTINVSDSAGWQMDSLPEKVAVNSLRQSELVLNVTLPNTLEAENIVTITAISQADPSVQATTEIRMGVVAKELPAPPPRGNEKADLVVAIDNSATMVSDLIRVSNALEIILSGLGGDDPSAKELEAFMKQHDNNPPDAELEAFLKQQDEKYPQSDDPLANFPMIELLTFDDKVVSHIVTKDIGLIVTQMRGLQALGDGDCPNASVAAIEQALANINDNGTIILATASEPHKEAAAVIEQAKQQGVKVNVMLAGSCGDEAADKALYQGIADGTGGTFKWLPGSTDDGGDIGMIEVITKVVTEGFQKFIPEDNTDTNDTDTGDTDTGDTSTGDTGTGDSGTGDTGTGDSGTGDTGTGDSGTGDSGTGDSGTGDSGTGDSGTGDSGTGDSGTGDSGTGDTGTGDSGTGETGTDDSGTGETETGDTGTSKPSSQTAQYTASGTLTNELGEPIVGATIQIADKETVTDAAGNWTITGLLEGTYQATMSSSGYEAISTDFSVGNDQNATIKFKPISLLKLSVSAKPSRVEQGENLTYLMLVTNEGAETATGMVLTDVLPKNTTLVSMEAEDGSCDASTLTCHLPDLGAGEQTSVTMIVNNTGNKALSNTATVKANEYPVDVQKTWTNVIPYLSVSLSDNREPLPIGERLKYSVVVNLSEKAPSDATGVELAMTLPNNFELKSVETDSGICELSSWPKVVCSLSDLSIDSQATVEIAVRLLDAGQLLLRHQASVMANEYPTHKDEERTTISVSGVDVDMVFIVDDSGSMQAEINGVKKALIEFINEIDSSQSPLMALITFKDEVTVRAFTRNLAVLLEAVKALKASGGGACEEASVEAINIGISHTKEGGLILFSTDASPYEDADVEGTIERLRNKGIRFNAMITGDCSLESSWNDMPNAD